MKKTPVYLLLLLFTFAGISACSKSDEEPETSVSEEAFPTLITSQSSAANAKLIRLFELKYNGEGRLNAMNYFNADSNYNQIVYDAKGQATKYGTKANPDAILLEYNAAGKVNKTTETTYVGKLKQVRVREFEHDAQGRLLKMVDNYSGGFSFTTNFTYDANGNITKAEYRSSASSNVSTRTFTYNDKVSPFSGKAVSPLLYIGMFIYANAIEFSSKNLVVDNIAGPSGDASYTHEYQYDSKNRVTKIIQKIKDSGKISSEYTITY